MYRCIVSLYRVITLSAVVRRCHGNWLRARLLRRNNINARWLTHHVDVLFAFSARRRFRFRFRVRWSRFWRTIHAQHWRHSTYSSHGWKNLGFWKNTVVFLDLIKFNVQRIQRSHFKTHFKTYTHYFPCHVVFVKRMTWRQKLKKNHD